MAPMVVHSYGGEGFVHSLTDLGGGNAQIFRAEGAVLFHHIGHDLVVRVLEHHAHGAADVQKLGLVGSVHAGDINLASRGEKDGVHVLGQSGFARAVMAQDGHKGPGLYLQINALKDRLGGILGG